MLNIGLSDTIQLLLGPAPAGAGAMAMQGASAGVSAAAAAAAVGVSTPHQWPKLDMDYVGSKITALVSY